MPNKEIEKVEYYARPGGWHFHTKRKCQMLAGGDFERLKYRLIEFSTVKRRRLNPCPGCSPSFYRRREE